jgi:hypothetical protein
MKKKNKTIEKELEALRFRELSDREVENSWQIIESRLEPAQAFSVWKLQIKRKTMIPLLIGALLFVSAGGTVAASNKALPGDALFPVDRAVENVRVALARNDGKAELKLKFAEERLGEVQALIARVRAQASASTTASTTATTTATSTPKKTSDNVALGVNVAISFLNDAAAEVSASGNTEAAAQIRSIVTRLENLANDSDVKVRLKNNGAFQLRLKGEIASSTASSTATTTGEVKINTSGNKSRIEVREDGGRIRIEIKDNGGIKIKSKIDSDDDDRDSRDRDDDDEDEDEDERKKDNRGRGVNLNSDLRLDLR